MNTNNTQNSNLNVIDSLALKWHRRNQNYAFSTGMSRHHKDNEITGIEEEFARFCRIPVENAERQIAAYIAAVLAKPEIPAEWQPVRRSLQPSMAAELKRQQRYEAPAPILTLEGVEPVTEWQPGRGNVTVGYNAIRKDGSVVFRPKTIRQVAVAA